MQHSGQHLPPGGVRTLLRDLGGVGEYTSPLEETWTGVITMTRADNPDTQAHLWLRGGQLYSADLTGFTPPMATRLVSAGCLSEDEAYELDTTVDVEQIGSVAAARYSVDRSIVEELHREVTLAVVSHLYEWEDATWVADTNDAFPGYMTSPMPLLLVVSAVDERIGQWRAVSRAHPRAVKPSAVPQPGPAWLEKTGQEVTPEMASLLSRVDGRASVARIANACGFTRFETARLLQQAIADGLLVFPPPQQTASEPTVDVPEPALPEGPDSAIPGEPHDLENHDQAETDDHSDPSGEPEMDSPSEMDERIQALTELIEEALNDARAATAKAEQAHAALQAIQEEIAHPVGD